MKSDISPANILYDLEDYANLIATLTDHILLKDSFAFRSVTIVNDILINDRDDQDEYGETILEGTMDLHIWNEQLTDFIFKESINLALRP